jgi:hypothetical protein
MKCCVLCDWRKKGSGLILSMNCSSLVEILVPGGAVGLDLCCTSGLVGISCCQPIRDLSTFFLTVTINKIGPCVIVGATLLYNILSWEQIIQARISWY